jgi:hypothetical protein
MATSLLRFVDPRVPCAPTKDPPTSGLLHPGGVAPVGATRVRWARPARPRSSLTPPSTPVTPRCRPDPSAAPSGLLSVREDIARAGRTPLLEPATLEFVAEGFHRAILRLVSDLEPRPIVELNQERAVVHPRLAAYHPLGQESITRHGDVDRMDGDDRTPRPPLLAPSKEPKAGIIGDQDGIAFQQSPCTRNDATQEIDRTHGKDSRDQHRPDPRTADPGHHMPISERQDQSEHGDNAAHHGDVPVNWPIAVQHELRVG